VPAPVPAPAPAHAGHAPVPAAATAATTAVVVNTICPICGMVVDPSIPPAAWDGVLVGFGCRACPPEFASDPAKYGAAARTNTVVEP
jgi:hypothetical protein